MKNRLFTDMFLKVMLLTMLISISGCAAAIQEVTFDYPTGHEEYKYRFSPQDKPADVTKKSEYELYREGYGVLGSVKVSHESGKSFDTDPTTLTRQLAASRGGELVRLEMDNQEREEYVERRKCVNGTSTISTGYSRYVPGYGSVAGGYARTTTVETSCSNYQPYYEKYRAVVSHGKVFKLDKDLNNELGYSVLYDAIANNRKEMILSMVKDRSFLAGGLIEAIKKGNLEIMKMLISEGADVNAYFEKSTPLSAAAASDPEISKFLIGKGAKVYSGLLYVAAEYGNVKLASFLLNNGLDVNGGNSDDNTPLLYAIYRYDTERHPSYSYREEEEDEHLRLSIRIKEYIKMLIEKGVDLNVKNIEGDTALMGAAKNNLSNIIELLAKKNIDVNKTDKDGETALMRACENDQVEAVKTLVQLGADVNARDKKGMTVLMYAALMRSWDKGDIPQGLGSSDQALDAHWTNANQIVKILIDKGAAVNAKDSQGNTALMYAVDAHRVKMVPLLILRGADMNAKNNDGETPYDIAKKRSVDMPDIMKQAQKQLKEMQTK